MRRSWLLPAACRDEALPAETFSPLAMSRWSEKSTGRESGPLCPVRFTILPTDGGEARGLRDAGLIVVRGPASGPPLVTPHPGRTGGWYSSVKASAQSRNSTTGRWTMSWRKLKPTISRAFRPRIPSSGSMKNGLMRFGRASAAL